jgi:adenine deaminase
LLAGETRGQTPSGRADLIAVARGDAPPDLVIGGAHVFSAFTCEWLETDVAVFGGVIAGLGEYEGGERVDASGQYLVPGFIDAHVHIESSKLVPAEFARAVVPHGTTAVITDPHEVANVLGPEGVEWMLKASEDLPLDVFVMAPSCVPASHFESPGCAFEPADMEAILRHPRALGIAEMMNFPGVIAGDERVLARFDVAGASHVDGHAPAVTGRGLNAYVAAGIRSDHEATTYDEALEKRRAGMWVLIREASNAHNLRDLLPVVRRFGPEHCAFCTDDREPDLLYREGHIDQMCRIAVQEGIRPEHALLMATLHPARAHRLLDRGAVAPGLRADLLLLDDLETFRPACVWKDGRLVAAGGAAEPFAAAAIPDRLRSTMRSGAVAAEDFAIPAGAAATDDGSSAPARVRVIEIIPGQLITHAREEEPTVRDGQIVADAERDLAKIAVVERHHETGRIGKGLVRGFGLRTGAFASTVAHDAHNVVIVGTTDADMAACAARLQEIGGGIVVARDGTVRGELPLPVAGLLSDQPVEDVVTRLEELQDMLRDQGVRDSAPFMTLSFLALSVIPALKITDRGLVDVERFALVPLTV